MLLNLNVFQKFVPVFFTGVPFGTLSTIDEELTGAQYTYQIVGDPSDMFSIVENQLVANREFNFEIRYRGTMDHTNQQYRLRNTTIVCEYQRRPVACMPH